MADIRSDTLLHATSLRTQPADHGHVTDLGRDFLEHVHDAMTSMLRLQDYWGAAELASTVPVLTSARLTSDLKLTYAKVLSLCAHVWGNQRNYRVAETCSRLAVRFFVERGFVFNMLQEIQNLSGLLNMANRVGDAHAINPGGLGASARYSGYPAIRNPDFRMLLNSFYDSRASILLRLGRWPKARDILSKAIPPDGDASPYTFAKFAVLLHSAGSTDLACRLVDEVALRLAEERQESVGYVARDAARIALSAGEHKRASSLLLQAENECLRHGQLHTLMQVQRLMRECSPS